MKNTKKIMNLLKRIYIILIVCIIICTIFLALNIVKSNMKDFFIVSENSQVIKSPKTFLFIGTDGDRPTEETTRADSLMLLTFNPNNNRDNLEVNFVSIPRDTISYITCLDEYGKINESYFIGSQISEKEAAQCTIDTISNFLNIPIDYYVETSFYGLIELVDKIDGIEIDSPYAFCEQDENGVKDQICIEKGVQTLSGQETLAYARQRKNSSDYERGLRQQQIMISTAKKIMSDPFNYIDEMISVYLSSFTSNIDLKIVQEIITNFVSTYNNYIVNISTATPVVLNIKTSEFTNLSNLGNTLESSIGIDTTNIYPQRFDSLYDEMESIESYTTVKELIFSKNATGVPTTIKPLELKPSEPLIIEFQSISIKSEEINLPTGWYGWVETDVLYYTSNILRLGLGLEVETPNFDYSIIQYFGGKVLNSNGIQ